ncbi:MAG: GntR family transcriptional regulator [Acidobacteriota bacterium]
MKFWLSKNSEIPVREQLITQITLGIGSGDLPAGGKLPSTREIARRFKIHANTVGFAYQILSEQGLIEFRKGNGFYVCESKQQNKGNEKNLDAIIANFFQTAQLQGFSETEIQNRLQKRFNIQTPEQILVIKSDENLRRILVEEIKQVTNLRVIGASFEELVEKYQNSNVIFVTMHDEKDKIESILSADKTRFILMPRSVSDSMKGKTRPQQNDLIAVVSGWEQFLHWSKTILVAANIENDLIILRSTADKQWKKGLQKVSMIICDFLTAKEFKNDNRIRVFRLVADSSLDKLKNLHINRVN